MSSAEPDGPDAVPPAMAGGECAQGVPPLLPAHSGAVRAALPGDIRSGDARTGAVRTADALTAAVRTAAVRTAGTGSAGTRATETRGAGR